jgi:predicted amidophosphoribosyltransferase
MEQSRSSSAGACCFSEKRRLVKELSNCGYCSTSFEEYKRYCSTSFEEYKRCRQEASRECGERSMECMIG